tara:strand:+ start:1078 stop:1341 length:264 start_codon:yes stop_codon:yes gene_type:complete
MNHHEILEIAKKQASNPQDVPKIETLHQNLAHMTVALKEVETRLLRVTNKMNRLKVEDRDVFLVPLAECVAVLKSKIQDTEDTLSQY